MIIVDNKLAERAAAGKPIQVGLIGAGEMAIGLVNQIERHVPGMRIAAIYNRTEARAKQAYATAGHESIVMASQAGELDDAIRSGKPAIAASLDLLIAAEQIDVIVEMTGAIGFSFEAIMKSFAAGKHVVTFNAEIDATVGPYLQRQARKAGVRYTLGDGDQPGVTLNLYRQVKAMGFNPLVCGNIKGMLDHYRNPDTQKGFAEQSGLSVNMVTSFADGTKVSLEQAAIANATGMRVAQRGMIGIEHTGHVDDLTDRYDIEQLKESGGIVEMVVGGLPGPGVFVFASTEDPVSRRFLEYGKLGKGPLYSFYVPCHLLFFELPFSIARLVDFNDGTLDSLDRFSVEVVATAKRDLKVGDTIDGMGGFDFFGECDNRETVVDGGFLPVGLIEGKRLVKDISKNQPITWSDVATGEASPVEQAYHQIQ
ncbi:NAD(P)H-dependent oxidoreductase [Coraliomargarita sp. W4R53]